MNNYKCVFFDLDHTLWDYETNSHETLQELFHRHALSDKGVTDFNSFLSSFRAVNAKLWDLYDRELITSDVIRKERFHQILTTFNIHDKRFCEQLSVEYLDSCPRKGNLLPRAIETLDYLSAKYRLTIITNGFEEIQHLKLQSGKADHFFDHMITSQKAGCKKPAKEIFAHALAMHAIESHEAIMIGDNLVTDIGGAHNAGIDAIYFNPEAISHSSSLMKHEIKNLYDLCSFL